MLITDGDPALNSLGMAGGVELYGMDNGIPKPMRSIRDVVEAQSRRIDDINSQLESARVALTERKTIERAKGILMRSRRLSEKDAYTLLRQTAMSQNKRIFDIAEAIISMVDIFKP
jgi:AmiR/NasT family two-component response regulator